jgi:hypothetical protein
MKEPNKYPKSSPPIKWLKCSVSSDTHQALKEKAHKMGLSVVDAIDLCILRWVKEEG